MLNEEILNQKARKFALKYWGLNLNIPIKINSRLRITSGSYKYCEFNGKHQPKRIEISKLIIDNYKPETALLVLKHELCHWALAKLKMPFIDGHPVFEKELKRINTIPTNIIRPAGKLHRGNCGKCNNIVVEGLDKRSLNPYIKENSKYKSTCCREKIVYKGIIYREDDNDFTTYQISGDFTSTVNS